ncbi:MAG: hypothetical protein Q8P52_03090 [bacterium]|nr:hypothetical protein [bacterium]
MKERNSLNGFAKATRIVNTPFVWTCRTTVSLLQDGHLLWMAEGEVSCNSIFGICRFYPKDASADDVVDIVADRIRVGKSGVEIYVRNT